MILCKDKNNNGNRYRNINVHNILEFLASPSILVEPNIMIDATLYFSIVILNM